MHDPTILPPGLPVPVDDGAADHLPGLELPDLRLPATTGGSPSLAELAAGALVLYLYPMTGRPDEEPPPGWDAIPGARGCTPQSLAFREREPDFARLGYRVAGLSAQPPGEQREAAERLDLPFPLLSDPELLLAEQLRLPTFRAGGRRLYKRLTIVARGGRIEKAFYPVFPANTSAAEVLAWIASDAPGP